MHNRGNTVRKRRPGMRRILMVGGVLLLVLIVAIIFVRRTFYDKLRPVSNSTATVAFTVSSGESSSEIGADLQGKGLVRSSAVFQWYISSKGVRDELQAGTYSLSPNMSVQQIVSVLVNGKIATNLVTIIPGERIDQVRETLTKAGFSAAAVDAALQPGQYASYGALADKPASASLEGFLYPDSFQKDQNTSPTTIVQESLTEMGKQLTPDVRSAFAKEGLSVYQGITLASIVEQEVSKASDRPQVAQVFLSRLKQGMALGSDVTAYYGAILAGQKPNTSYDTPYNTLLHKGLPPGPISNVSNSSLQAVAHPAKTDWLYFVSGDNGTTYFSKTLQDHEALTKQYCHKLCSGTQ